MAALALYTPGGGMRGVPYSYQMKATGGTPPYTFSISSGLLPTGLTLVNGVLSGTPTILGLSGNVVIKVTDSKGATASIGPFSFVFR